MAKLKDVLHSLVTPFNLWGILSLSLKNLRIDMGKLGFFFSIAFPLSLSGFMVWKRGLTLDALDVILRVYILLSPFLLTVVILLVQIVRDDSKILDRQMSNKDEEIKKTQDWEKKHKMYDERDDIKEEGKEYLTFVSLSLLYTMYSLFLSMIVTLSITVLLVCRVDLSKNPSLLEHIITFIVSFLVSYTSAVLIFVLSLISRLIKLQFLEVVVHLRD